MTATARLDVLDLLTQTDIWIARDPDDGALVTHRIDDMDDRHRAAVLSWLRDRARMLHRGVEVDLYEAWKRDQAARRDIEEEMSHHQHTSPAVWLEEQPLVQHLARVAPRRPPLERRRRVRRLGGGGCR